MHPKLAWKEYLDVFAFELTPEEASTRMFEGTEEVGVVTAIS